MFWVDTGRWKNSGDADLQIGQRAEIHFELGGRTKRWEVRGMENR
jgi:hypothetical protein